MTRALLPLERALLSTLLEHEEGSGGQSLRAQLESIQVVDATPTFMRFAAVPGTKAAPVEDGPRPWEGTVLGADGSPVGGLMIWTAHGFLSALEYFWFGTDVPGSLPDHRRIRVMRRG